MPDDVLVKFPLGARQVAVDSSPCTVFAQELHRITGRYLEGIGEPHHDLWSLARRVIWEYRGGDAFKLAEAIDRLADFAGRPRTEDEV